MRGFVPEVVQVEIGVELPVQPLEKVAVQGRHEPVGIA